MDWSSFSQVAGFAMALIGGAGAVGAVVAAGVWDKFVKNKVRTEVIAYQAEPATIEAFEKAVVKVLDNQINRRDGIIHSEISKQVENGNATVLKELQTLRKELGDFSEIGTRLGHIEGSIQVLLTALSQGTVKSPGPARSKE